MIILIYLGIGAVIGLLLNYLADVLPATRKFSRPVCVKCGHKFSAGEYLFSFQCPECKAKPNTRYWIVLVLSMVLSIALVIFPLYPFNYWLSLPLVTFLSLVLIIDVEHRAVLFETDIAGILICIIYGLLLHTPLTTIIERIGVQ